MNYEPNTISWNIGNIVIHDADAKRENMLMKVIAREQNAGGQLRYICAYIDESYHRNQKGLTKKEFNKWNRWNNSRKPLHDPKIFGLKTDQN